ncbi:MAG: hypothetical protein JW774_05455 [Candidatus Aureabacteria bacterium]|nr:hypothetical protein [Candidatus Auribacterota bacterium]
MDDDKKEIEFYIAKLQQILTKAITESKEFQELKKLIDAEDSDFQMCVFSILADKNNPPDFLKNLDMKMMQQMFAQQAASQEAEELWSKNDVDFLKSIHIRLE